MMVKDWPYYGAYYSNSCVFTETRGWSSCKSKKWRRRRYKIKY